MKETDQALGLIGHQPLELLEQPGADHVRVKFGARAIDPGELAPLAA